MGKFDQRVVVVLGGTAGIGLSATSALVAAGGQVVVVGREEDQARAVERELGPSVRVLAGDATDPATATAALDCALRAFGRVDAWYHVAGGSGRRRGDGPVDVISDEGWDYTLRLNLTSAFYSTRTAVHHWRERRQGGSLLLLGSVLGQAPSNDFFATHAYASAKAGLLGLVRSAAAYYAPDNIRVNALVPALVETPMSQRAVGDAAIMAFVRTKQPLDGGRIGRPSDLDAAALYFLHDDSRFVTGQILCVDGGWSVTEGQKPATATNTNSASQQP